MKRDQETIADDLKTSIVDEDASYIVHLDKEDVSYATWERMHCLSLSIAIYGVIDCDHGSPE